MKIFFRYIFVLVVVLFIYGCTDKDDKKENPDNIIFSGIEFSKRCVCEMKPWQANA